MKNYQCIPGCVSTYRMVKSGFEFTNSMVKSALEFTKIHSPHFKALEFTFSTIRFSKELTICTLKSAFEFTTSTFPYSGIPLKVQFSLSKTGSWLMRVLSGLDNIINGNNNEINKLVIA